MRRHLPDLGCALTLSLAIASPVAAAPTTITIHPEPLTRQEQAETQLHHIAGGTDLVDQDAWTAERGATVKDMLEYSPGVFVQPRNGAEASRLSIRGSGLSEQFQGRGLLIMQDGVPLNMPDGSFDFHEISPWQTAFAEIYRGANGFERGTSNLGGAIDFITPTGRMQQGALLRGEAGSFGTRHGQASYGMQEGEFDAYASGIYFMQDGYRNQSDNLTRRFSGNMGFQLNEATETRFFLNYTGSHAAIPGTLSKDELSGDPQIAKPINAARHYARFLDSTRLANRTTWESDGVSLDSTLYFRDRSLENPVFTFVSNDTQDFGWRGGFDVDTEQGRWSGGVNLAYGRGKELRYDNIGGKRGAFIIERREQAGSYEAYTQYDHYVTSQLTAIAGLQFSYATRRIEERFPGQATFEEDYAGVNPRIGLLYDLLPSAQLYSNVSRSFEPPTTGNLSGGNDPGARSLDAQTATTFEIGTRGERQGWAWDISTYHAVLDDELISFQFPDGTSDTVNADDTTHSGLELALDGIVMRSLAVTNDRLRLKTAYQFNYFRLHDDASYGNKSLPGVPEHYLLAELLYEHPSGVSAGPNLEWVPKAPYIDLSNTYDAQSYALLGAELAWQPEGKPYRFYIEARNLLDKTYIATFDVQPDAGGSDLRAFYPGEGRAIYAGFSLWF